MSAETPNAEAKAPEAAAPEAREQKAPSAREPSITITDQSNGTPAWETQAAEAAAEAKAAPERGENGQFKAKEKPEAEADESEGNQLAEGDGEGKRLPVGIEKRVQRATRQRDTAKAERDEFATKLEELTGIAEKLLGKGVRAPEPGDYKTHPEYLEAKREHDEAVTAAREKIAAAKDKPAAAGEPWQAALAEVKAEVEAANADLWKRTLASPDVEISQSMILALADHDDTPGALAWLLDNPAEADRISKLTTARQMAAVLGIKAKAEPAPAPKKVTAADDPPSLVNTRGGGPSVTLDKMSMADFKAARNAEEKAGDRFGW